MNDTDTDELLHDEPADEPEHCKPLGLNFEHIAAAVEAAHADRGTPKTLRSVEHALGHLREETGLGDRQIARVLLTAACLLGELASTAGTKWNGTATTNWISSCGARLWNENED